MVRPLLALLLVPALAVAAPVPKALKAKGSPLDGWWRKLVPEREDGPLEETDLIWEIRGEEMFIWHDGEAEGRPSTYRLVPPADGGAGQIDFVPNPGGGITHTSLGLFALDGDMLTICVAAPRPTGVGAGNGRRVFPFRRTHAPK